MLIPSGRFSLPFTCVDSTGAPVAPTGTPTAVLVKNGTDIGTTVTVTMSTANGNAVCTIPSDAVADDRFHIRLSAVISGMTYTLAGPADSIQNPVTLPTIPTDWINSNGIAADAIGASELASSAITEIQSGLATSASIVTLQADVTTLLGRITSTLFSGITSLKNWLGSIAGKTADATTLAEINATTAGATYTGITDSLQAIRDRGDAAWGGGGSSLTGANVVTITIDDGTDPVPGALVRVTAGAETDVKRTDASGVVVFSLDDNTWTISATASRLSFTPTTLAVTTTTTATYSMDAATPTGDTWATGNDLVVYYDAQTIGQMLKDDKTAVAIGDVPSHAIVEKMLLLATGEVNSALTVSNRYTVEQLATLTDASLEHLKNITCAVAMWHLSERRVPTNPELQESRRKLAESKLERLRKGETALDVAEVREAGVASGIEYVSMETSLLLRDRMSGKAFPYRRTLR